MAGRVTLARSAVECVPYYVMQTAQLPVTVCDEIESKTRQFIWGSTEEKRKVHLLNWEKVRQPKEWGGLGMRSMRQANSAFMTKMGYRLLTEPENLWSRVVLGKYCSGRCDQDMFTKIDGASNLWQGMVNAKTHLLKGLRTAVGDGQKTLFWSHSWVIDGPLEDAALSAIPEEELAKTVSEYWDGVTWKWDALCELLPGQILAKIAAHELVNEELADNFYWAGNANGRFSIKSTIEIIRGERDEPVNGVWKRIWAAEVPERIKTFIWMVTNNCILSNENRRYRHLGGNGLCPECSDMVESTLHIVRDCRKAQRVWAAFVSGQNLGHFNSMSLQEWIGQNLGVAGDWPAIFATTVWWLWRWRNSRIFGSAEEIPDARKEFILSRQIEFTRARNSVVRRWTRHGERADRQGRMDNWERPPAGWYCLNTDGSYKPGAEHAGAGGLLRNQLGEFIRGFASWNGGFSAFQAELLGISQGLQMAKELGLRRLIVQCDAAEVVKLLSDSQLKPNELYGLVHKCRKMINDESWTVKLMQIGRAQNKAADWLSKAHTDLEDNPMLITSPPDALKYIISSDILLSVPM